MEIDVELHRIAAMTTDDSPDHRDETDRRCNDAVIRCKDCGMAPRSFEWWCPKCGSWKKYVNLSEEENDGPIQIPPEHRDETDEAVRDVPCAYNRRSGDTCVDCPDWENCPGWCPICGEPFETVRPGKTQPVCDCQDKEEENNGREGEGLYTSNVLPDGDKLDRDACNSMGNSGDAEVADDEWMNAPMGSPDEPVAPPDWRGESCHNQWDAPPDAPTCHNSDCQYYDTNETGNCCASDEHGELVPISECHDAILSPPSDALPDAPDHSDDCQCGDCMENAYDQDGAFRQLVANSVYAPPDAPLCQHCKTPLPDHYVAVYSNANDCTKYCSEECAVAAGASGLLERPNGDAPPDEPMRVSPRNPEVAVVVNAHADAIEQLQQDNAGLRNFIDNVYRARNRDVEQIRKSKKQIHGLNSDVALAEIDIRDLQQQIDALKNPYDETATATAAMIRENADRGLEWVKRLEKVEKQIIKLETDPLTGRPPDSEEWQRLNEMRQQINSHTRVVHGEIERRLTEMGQKIDTIEQRIDRAQRGIEYYDDVTHPAIRQWIEDVKRRVTVIEQRISEKGEA